MLIDVAVDTKVSQTVRARQLSTMFDVPPQDAHRLSWRIDAPWEDREWNVGLIVGPSGAGKSTIARHVWGDAEPLTWDAPSVIDAFGKEHSVQSISEACSAVGFNSIPAWLRPYNVLSNGEQFRVSLARHMLDTPADRPIVVDEFTSVVDRQVAQIGSHAVQKWARRNGRQFVAVTCHYDVIEWLQPDWIIDAARGEFTWRSVLPRPRIDAAIRAVPYDTWRLFAPYHYLTSDLHRAARCYALHVNDDPVAFAGVMRRPHPKANNIMGVSRLVTLPDWQGLGLAFVLVDALGGAYAQIGERLRTYPAHPSLIRGFDKSPLWRLEQRPGYGVGDVRKATSKQTMKIKGKQQAGIVHGPNAELIESWRHGARPCAVFEYAGPKWGDRDEAVRMLEAAHGRTLR